MTREEALIYLPAQDEEERDEQYEEKLFELKQFFLNRFPVSKVIRTRLDKMYKVEIAFKALGGELITMAEPISMDLPNFPSLPLAFDWYHRQRNALRLRLNAAQSVLEIESYLDQLLRLTKHYATFWEIELNVHDAQLIIGKEPDPMEIQEAFKEFGNDEQLTSDSLARLADENCLKVEAKRLTRWLVLENESSIT